MAARSSGEKTRFFSLKNILIYVAGAFSALFAMARAKSTSVSGGIVEAGGSPRSIASFFSLKNILIYVFGGGSAFFAMAVGALVVVEGGLFNATASTPHLRVVAIGAHTAFIRSVQVRARHIRAPARFTATEVTAGFRDYDRSCVACHGAPGVSNADWAQAMTPPPPYLEDMARRWTPAQLDWIVGQGAKMTAMPAWAEVRTDGEVWNLVAFLEALPYLTAKDYARMRAGTRDANATAPHAFPSPPVPASSAPG